MPDQLLALGVIGVRLCDCILTAPATYPDELADHVIEVINDYLCRATPHEKYLLFHLSRDVHEAFSLAYGRVDCLENRKSLLLLVNVLITRARVMAKQCGN